MSGSAVKSRSIGWALVVIDMQNAFCHPRGSFAHMLQGSALSIEMCEKAIPNCKRLVEFAHGAGAPVIYTAFVYQQGYTDGGVLVRKYPAIPRMQALLAGSWDAAIVDELRPRGSDVVLEKSRYSAFYGTDLSALLDGHDVRALVICGVTTNVCVESTARDAAQRDYDVIVVSDATGELSGARHTNALEILDYGFATVATTSEVETLWGVDDQSARR